MSELTEPQFRAPPIGRLEVIALMGSDVNPGDELLLPAMNRRGIGRVRVEGIRPLRHEAAFAVLGRGWMHTLRPNDTVYKVVTTDV